MTALAGQSGTVPLFATPFTAVNTGADRHFNARLATLCESQRSAPDLPADPSRDPLHFRGRDDFLDSTDATAGELKRLVLGSGRYRGCGPEQHRRCGVRQAANSGARLVFDRAAERSCPSPALSECFVACSVLRASWRARYRLKSAGVLRLYERRLASIYRDASTWELKSPYRYGNHTWTPVPGWMALFPAHVPHEVSVVRSVTSLILVFAMIRFMDASAKDSRYG